jgi:hypothetical protein
MLSQLDKDHIYMRQHTHASVCYDHNRFQLSQHTAASATGLLSIGNHGCGWGDSNQLGLYWGYVRWEWEV